jgi:hypothetical protein
MTRKRRTREFCQSCRYQYIADSLYGTSSRHTSQPRYCSKLLWEYLQSILLVKDEVFLLISICRANSTHRLEHLDPSQNHMASDLAGVVLEIIPMYEGAFHVER